MTKNYIKMAAGLWDKIIETGVEYEQRIREGWETRRKREFNE